MPLRWREHGAGRLPRPSAIGVVRATRALNLSAGRQLAAGGATLVDLEPGGVPESGSVDLIAAAGAGTALTAARFAVDLDVPLLVLPDEPVPDDLGARLDGAPVTRYPALSYRVVATPRLAVAEVHVASSDDAAVTVTMEVAGERVAERLDAAGLRLLSGLPLPGWPHPLPALHPRLGAVLLADGDEPGAPPKVRAILPHDAIVSVTAPGGLSVQADRYDRHPVTSGDGFFLGPHDATLRFVTLPTLDSRRTVTHEHAGLARFARRITSAS